MELIIGIVGGGIISWAITHLYYKIAGKEQKKQGEELGKKLSKEVKEVILNAQKDNLTVGELNSLLEEKIIDKDSIGKNPLPYKACRQCGNTELEWESLQDEEHDRMYYFVHCKECGWCDGTE